MKYHRQNATFHFEADTFAINVQGVGKIYHESLIIIKLLQTKPRDRCMNISFYDLYFTVMEKLTKC